MVAALRNGRDAVSHFQTAIRLRWPTRNQTLDFGVTIFRPQHRSDADKGEPHINAEILQVGFAEILGVRVVGLGQGVKEELYLFLPVLFMDTPKKSIVTPRDELRSRFDRMFAQVFLKQFALNTTVPD